MKTLINVGGELQLTPQIHTQNVPLPRKDLGMNISDSITDKMRKAHQSQVVKQSNAAVANSINGKDLDDVLHDNINQSWHGIANVSENGSMHRSRRMCAQDINRLFPGAHPNRGQRKCCPDCQDTLRADGRGAFCPNCGWDNSCA